ncbi:MAG: hypothetical protein K2W88_07100 [Pararheinheimera sp.]|nr:hypothetical protein [Rheinheimera sp.]
MDNVHELRTVLPGLGLVTLYRAKTAEKARSFQRYNELKIFNGHKVSLVEVIGEHIDRTLGWVYQPAPVREVRYV